MSRNSNRTGLYKTLNAESNFELSGKMFGSFAVAERNKEERKHEKDLCNFIVNKVLNQNNLTKILGTTKNLFEKTEKSNKPNIYVSPK